jgi:hypothetical protein
MNMTTNSLVQKPWNYCNILRDDGMSYGGYVEQFKLIAADMTERAIE